MCRLTVQMFRTISEKLERVDEIKNMLLQLQSSFQEFREDSVDRLNNAGPKAKTFRFLALDEKVSIHKKPKAPKRIVWEEPVQQDKEKEKTPPVRNAFFERADPAGTHDRTWCSDPSCRAVLLSTQKRVLGDDPQDHHGGPRVCGATLE